MKNIKSRIENLNLNYKNEMIKLAIMNVLILGCLAFVMFMFFNIILLTFCVFLLIFSNYFFISRYSILEKKTSNDLDEDFIEMFSYLRIYLFNQETVYQSLNNILDFSSPKMKAKLEILIKEIDEDKSIKPYISFSKNFKNKVIEEVMISLYEIVNSGNSDLYLNQFIKVFEELKTRTERDKQEKKMNFLDNINVFSIVGSGIIMITLAFAVISLLGEATNGL